MNDHIEELAQQCEGMTICECGSTGFNHMKFAKLLIAECLSIVEDSREDGWWPEKFEEHFGNIAKSEKVETKPKCSVCGTTENVRWMGGYQPWLCDSDDCIPF